MTTSNRFEDRLLEQLRHVVAERPAPNVVTLPHRAPRRTRLALAGAGVAAATAVAVIVGTSGDVTPSAYAVEPRPDGSVTVEIRSLADADGLERSLRAAGVPAVVDYVPAGKAGCVQAAPVPAPTEAPSSGTSEGPSLSTGGGGTSHVEPARPGAGPKAGQGASMSSSSVRVDDDGGVTFTIDPGSVKPGEKVYISTSTGAVSSIAMAVTKDAPPPMPCPPAR